MAMIGTTEESSFLVYVVLRIEEIANRIVPKLLTEEYDRLKGDDFHNAMWRLISDEMCLVKANFYAEFLKLDPEEQDNLHKQFVENKPTTRPTFGVVQTDGTIEPISLQEDASEEFNTVMNLLWRTVHNSYMLKTARQLIKSNSKMMKRYAVALEESQRALEEANRARGSLIETLEEIIDEKEREPAKNKPVKQAEAPVKGKLRIRKIKLKPT